MSVWMEDLVSSVGNSMNLCIAPCHMGLCFMFGADFKFAFRVCVLQS